MGGRDISPSPLTPPLKRRFWRYVGVGLLLALCAIWWTRGSWLPIIGTALNVSDPLSPASAVMILPGSEETRPFVAAGLLKAGYADVALVLETRANPDVRDGAVLATSETSRQILLRRGIPEQKIVLLKGASDSTFQDATALGRYFEQFGETDVIIVTNAYHSRRARWCFRHVLPNQHQRLRFYSAPNGFDDRHWWTSRGGRQSVLSEWLKFAYYVMRHGHSWLWCMVTSLLVGTLVFARRRPSGI